MNRNNIVIILAATLALGLASCSSARYASPEADTDGLFRNENPTDTATIADISWNEYFTDPYLRDMIDEGIRNNFDLAIAYTRIQQAEENLRMAKSAFFPTVALAGQAEHRQFSKGPDNVLGGHADQFTLGIASTWEVELWGKLSSRKRSQYAQFLNSHAYRNLIQTSLVANIATSYYALMALDEQLKVTKDNVAIMEETAQAMQDMFDAGLQTRAAVRQSLGVLYNAKATIPDLEARIWQTENAICTMLGRKPGPIGRSEIGRQSLPAQMDHGVPVQLLSRRPDVQQAELAFRSAFELTTMAKRSFYPSLTLGTGSLFAFSSTTLSQFFKPENLFANILGGLTQPLFSQRQLKGNLAIAKAQQEAALLTFEKTVLAAGQEVSNIIYSYRASLGKNDVRTRQVESLRGAVEDTDELYKSGESNYLEVLTAQQGLLSAQLSQVNDKLEQLQYTVTLYKALGGGYDRGE